MCVLHGAQTFVLPCCVLRAVCSMQAGKKQGDPALGRYLADTMAVVPRFAKAEFERLFNDSVQDQLMVSYLANMLRAQVRAQAWVSQAWEGL